MPDKPLLALADAGGLAISAQIMQQAEAMLSATGGRAQVMMDDFVLRVSRDDAAFTPSRRPSSPLTGTFNGACETRGIQRS